MFSTPNRAGKLPLFAYCCVSWEALKFAPRQGRVSIAIEVILCDFPGRKSCRYSYPVDLGMGALVSATGLRHCCRFCAPRACLCHCVGPACSFVNRLRSGHRWISVLRPETAEDLSLGLRPVAHRDSIWHLRPGTKELAALASAPMCSGDAHVLDFGRGKRMSNQ